MKTYNSGREKFQGKSIDIDFSYEIPLNPSQIYNEKRATIRRVKRRGWGAWKPISFLIKQDRDKYIQDRWNLRKRERELRAKLAVKKETTKVRKKI